MVRAMAFDFGAQSLSLLLSAGRNLVLVLADLPVRFPEV
jgi:hypothetical protein